MENKWIGIMGSPKCTPAMDQYLSKLMTKAINDRVFIMFGDEPTGVPMYIAQRLKAENVDPKLYSVCTPVGSHPRNWDKLEGKARAERKRFEDYLSRNYNIVDFADSTVLIWSGEDELTRLTWEYAQHSNRKCTLVNFFNGGPKIECNM